MINSRIIRHDSGFLIEADGKHIPPYAYISYQPSKADYTGFQKAGVRLYSTGVYAGDRGINPVSGIRPFRPGFWKGPDTFDFSAVDEDFRKIVLDAAPGEVYLLPRLMLEPPSWWEAAHPEAVCRDYQGAPLRVSYAEPGFSRAMEPPMRAFQVWLEWSGWDKYVLGWHLACGSTEEFIRPVLHARQYADFSEQAKREFRVWLTERYGSVERLNHAWNAEYTAIDDVQPPHPSQRAYCLHGELRDPVIEVSVIDYYRYHSEALASAVIRVSRLAKDITGGRQIMGAFYGYTVNVPNPEHGHAALGMLLADDAVDFLASPFTYMDRRAAGVDWPFQGPVTSAALHGKPWFMEADVRTNLSKPISQCMTFANPVANDRYDETVWWGPDTIEGSLGQMGKAFARVLTHHTAIWWFDMWGGWYDAPELMAFQAKARAIYESETAAGTMRQSAQIALFFDEKVYSRLQPGGLANNQTIYILLKELGWLGAPYHVYLLSDLENVDPAQYRMAIFPFATDWTESHLAALKRWKSAERLLLFTGIPGSEKVNPTLLTGIAWQPSPYGEISAARFRSASGDQLEAKSAARFETSGSDHSDNIHFPEESPELPVPELLPAKTDIVVRRLDNGAPGLVLHRGKTELTAWSLPLVLPSALLRDLALAAGVHIYNFDCDVVYANDTYAALHARTAGSKRLYLPRKGSLRDAFTDEVLEGCESFTDFLMQAGETRLFKIQWAEENI
ncbi:hypothetical protein AGMMS49992_16950 [Clostridia bacterium]|nr:hypothetical protein AGMMS49992_16950 [Clostridia bacterium]